MTIIDTSMICKKVIDEVEKAIVGKRGVLEMIMAATLAGGHVLLEDFPGLGKTLIAKSFATVLGLTFKRLQFTPDMLPADITGGYVYNRVANKFELHQGPIFANIILADEINRASPKTQSALLEAMQEGQVTLEGQTMQLPEPFLVLATQNPIEYEGTFPLPEAQLDRFMIKVSVGYPVLDDEVEIMQRRINRKQETITLRKITHGSKILDMRKDVEEMHVNPDLQKYIASLVHATREDRHVAIGASPRGSLAFLKMARALAAIRGRDYVVPADIKHFAIPVLSHRMILKPEFWLTRQLAERVITDIFNKVPIPVLEAS